MDSTKDFLIRVTHELLYNIVYEANKISYGILSKRFIQKTSHRPMDFFGFGNKTDKGWLKFLKSIPSFQGRKSISLSDGDDESIYKMFNTTNFYEDEGRSTSVAKYREMLLIKCCQTMEGHFKNLRNCKDGHDNTPLHILAALPGLNYDCCALVNYMLKSGVDPLATNKDGQTFLHIIFGRYKPEKEFERSIESDVLWFSEQRVVTTKWFAEDRIFLLDALSEKLSQSQRISLMEAQDKYGNTVMHEFVLASPNINVNEAYVCELLLQFGAVVSVPNNCGKLPLGYTFNESVFNSLADAAPHARTDCHNPVLSVLMYSASLAFSSTSALLELVPDQSIIKPTNNSSINKALTQLTKLLRIVDNPSLVDTSTRWLPDDNGNVAIHIILIAIRLASYWMGILQRYNKDSNNIDGVTF